MLAAENGDVTPHPASRCHVTDDDDVTVASDESRLDINDVTVDCSLLSTCFDDLRVSNVTQEVITCDVGEANGGDVIETGGFSYTCNDEVFEVFEDDSPDKSRSRYGRCSA